MWIDQSVGLVIAIRLSKPLELYMASVMVQPPSAVSVYSPTAPTGKTQTSTCHLVPPLPKLLYWWTSWSVGEEGLCHLPFHHPTLDSEQSHVRRRVCAMHPIIAKLIDWCAPTESKEEGSVKHSVGKESQHMGFYTLLG